MGSPSNISGGKFSHSATHRLSREQRPAAVAINGVCQQSGCEKIFKRAHRAGSGVWQPMKLQELGSP
jgi:hypothetical protein